MYQLRQTAAATANRIDPGRKLSEYGSFRQSGSSNAQQTGSSNAQQTGSSNAQQTENSDAQQTQSDNTQDTGSEQQTRNENQNTYTRPENAVYAKEKNSIVSVILSFLFPGAGQVYNGNLNKGLMMVAGAIITLFIFFPASFVVWIYNLYDAYTDADKMNKGQIPYAEATTQDVLIYAGAFIGLFVVLFIVFFIIGLLFGALMFF